MKIQIKVHLLLFMANFFYGINYTAAKYLMPHYIGPQGFIVLRVGISGLLFALFCFVFIQAKISIADMKLFFLSSVFGVVLNQSLFFLGLSMTTPIHAALIMITTPVLVYIISCLFQSDKISIYKVFGIIIAFTGAFILMVLGKSMGRGTNTLLGDICIFLNATSYALYLTISKPLLDKYNPLTVVTILFALAFPIVLALGWQQVLAVSWGVFTPKLWWALASVILGATFFAYLFNSIALQYSAPSVVGSYIYLQPIIATVIAIYFFHEELSINKLIAALLIFTGVFLVSKKT